MTASFGPPISTVPVAGSSRENDDLKMGVLVQNLQDDSSFSQWITAMKMVVQLPGGIPNDFRSRLWLSLADRYLTQRKVHWKEVEKVCFNEVPQPDDTKLGNQITKDLHRTGCNLFCGEAGKENQILLKKVLLAYARWNKNVGYCQGFNMLAALILQVTNKCVQDALKIMIYLVEGVLPDSYFANNLRGLSVDMAVFRDLMHLKLPKLSQHLERLQNSTIDGNKSYEPPLTNVFTIQWFLTLFCNCLPQPTVLRIWDLIFLEGNEILLKTALCIWKIVGDKILEVQTADEFYGTMAELTKRLLSCNFISPNALVRAIVAIGPLNGLDNLRKQYLCSLSNKCNQPVSKKQHRQTIPLDISVLKKQYSKIKQRQKQAHVIFFSALSRQQNQTQPEVINHLMVKKTSSNQTGKIQACKSSPQLEANKNVLVRSTANKGTTIMPHFSKDTLHWKDESKDNCSSSSSSTDTELCDEDNKELSENEEDSLKLVKSKRNADVDNTSASKKLQSLNSNHLGANLEQDTINKINNDEPNENLMIFEHDLNKKIKNSDAESIFNSRRSDLNVFKIMQENSMILHRIMNCQNLTPSPSIGENVTDLNTNLYSLKENNLSCTTSVSGSIDLVTCDNTDSSNTDFSKILASPSFLISKNLEDNTVPYIFSQGNVSPQHRKLLFEKSISLDEKCNDLSLKKNLSSTSLQGNLHESKSESFIDNYTSIPEEPLILGESSSTKTAYNLNNFNQNDMMSKENSFSLNKNNISPLLPDTYNHCEKLKEPDEIAPCKLIKENIKSLHLDTSENTNYEDATPNQLLCDRSEIFMLKEPYVFSHFPSIETICDSISHDCQHNNFPLNEETDNDFKISEQLCLSTDNEKVIEKTSRELIEENVRVLELVLNRKKSNAVD